MATKKAPTYDFPVFDAAPEVSEYTFGLRDPKTKEVTKHSIPVVLSGDVFLMITSAKETGDVQQIYSVFDLVAEPDTAKAIRRADMMMVMKRLFIEYFDAVVKSVSDSTGKDGEKAVGESPGSPS